MYFENLACTWHEYQAADDLHDLTETEYRENEFNNGQRRKIQPRLSLHVDVNLGPVYMEVGSPCR